jgi:hypothetical protein
MTQVDQSTSSTTPNSIFAELGEIGKKRAEAMAAAQTELLHGFQEISQHWVARAKSEAELASELVAKLTSARSIPETATAYQEWASRRMRLAIEDSQRLFADGLKPWRPARGSSRTVAPTAELSFDRPRELQSTPVRTSRTTPPNGTNECANTLCS